MSPFVVIPIRGLVYSAGATVAMEASAMARAVVAFRSRGISEYVIDGETGILVEPGNVNALRSAIQTSQNDWMKTLVNESWRS